MNRYTQLLVLALIWLAFIAAGPRFLDQTALAWLTIFGMVGTFVFLSRDGLVRRKDPLSLSATGRRPWWETR
jgi:hypothetical protein